MRLQFLVSTVNEEVETLAQRMNLQADAIVVNQCDRNEYREYTYEAYRIRCYSFAERGVGLSRNNCLMRADRELCLFADEDIIYRPGAAKAVIAEFEKNPDADMILFNVDVPRERQTYHIDGYGRVRWYNCGRYPTFSFAARTKKLHEAGVTFSLLFGGGAKYSNGEDSLFLAECIRKGLKVYKAPVTIGRENGRPSTWFHGYNEKFFYDRGVLYRFLYGWAAFPMAVRFLLKNRTEMFERPQRGEEPESIPAGAAVDAPGKREEFGMGLSMGQAFSLMRKGIRMKE